MTETTLEMWWPSPDSFGDLTVTETEEGWQLSAPDDTELSEWIAFWDQSEEHRSFFNVEFLAVLTQHALNTLEQHGENEVLPDGSQSDRKQAEDVSAGSQP